MVFREQTDEEKPIYRIYTCTYHFINNFVCLKDNQRRSWIYNVPGTLLLFSVMELLNT